MRRELLLAGVLCFTLSDVIAASRPPSIITEPENDIYFKAGETIILPCVAEATSNISYTWKKNGVDFGDNVVQLPNVGTLVFSSPESRDEGIYQCFAINAHGKSASKKIVMREAKLMNFNNEPPITYSPQLGFALTLSCVPPQSVPRAQVFWVIKEKSGAMRPVVYDTRITTDHEFRLRITNVESSDHQNGNAYVCMALNSMLRKNVAGHDQFINPQNGTNEYRPATVLWTSPSDLFGLRGDPFKIKCIFAGNPTPNVYWTRDGRPLPDSAKISSFGQELVFDQIEYSDNGTYVCSATNSMSPQRVERAVSVRVDSRPHWIEKPKDVEIGIGETARFKCLTEATPPGSITWFINTVHLKDVTDPRIDQRFKLESPNEAVFMNVTSEDSMVIQCNVSNKYGYVWGDMYLSVLPDSAPNITLPPSQVKVAEEQSVNLTCRTTGKPDPMITWYKDDIQITDVRYRKQDNGDLLITNAVLADAGNFRCVAINKYGSQSASGVLMVRRKTQIVQTPVDVLVNAGFDAKFTCSATTDPAESSNLEIKWMKDNREITTEDRRMAINKLENSLTIFGTLVFDSANYTCIATNGLDNATASAILTVRDRPDPPMMVTLERCAQNTATVRWIPAHDNNAPILYFTIEYNTSFIPEQWIKAATVNSDMRNANITLSPWANYTFRVLAHNVVGQSSPSFFTRSVCSTMPDLPFKHPDGVRTIGDKKKSLHIVWNALPQIEHNGPGFEYILFYKRPADVKSRVIVIGDWRVDNGVFPTGDTYRPYEIKLRSRNALGNALTEVTTITGYSGEDVPTITPTIVNVTGIDGAKAILIWKFPMDLINVTDTPVRGEFQGFRIQVRQRDQIEAGWSEWNITRDQAERILDENHFNTTISGLQPYTFYDVQVAVMNNFYIGRPSDSFQFLTGQGDVSTTTAVKITTTTTSTSLPSNVWTTTTTKTTTTTTSTAPPWVMVTTSAPDGCDVKAIDRCMNPLIAIYNVAKGDKEIICPVAEEALSCLNNLMSCVDNSAFTQARHIIDDQMQLPRSCPAVGQFPRASSATMYRSVLNLMILTLIAGYIMA